MAHHKQAVKRFRQSVKHEERNRAVKSQVRTQVKQFTDATESSGAAKSAESLQKTLKQTVAVLARAAQKGVIPKKRAARKTSRIAKRVNALKK